VTTDAEMRAMLQDVPEVLVAYEEFKRFSSDPEMQEKVRARERFLTDQYLDRANAHAKGRDAGLVEGEMKKAREIAQNLKRLGIPLSTIAETTGLSVSEVERLG